MTVRWDPRAADAGPWTRTHPSASAHPQPHLAGTVPGTVPGCGKRTRTVTLLRKTVVPHGDSAVVLQSHRASTAEYDINLFYHDQKSHIPDSEIMQWCGMVLIQSLLY